VRPLPQAPAQREFVGREDRPLLNVDVCLASALWGQRQAIFVTGEAGIGKTALVDVFQQQATRRPNLRLARGQCNRGLRGKGSVLPILESAGLAGSQRGRRFFGPDAGETHAPTWLISVFPRW